MQVCCIYNYEISIRVSILKICQLRLLGLKWSGLGFGMESLYERLCLYVFVFECVDVWVGECVCVCVCTYKFVHGYMGAFIFLFLTCIFKYLWMPVSIYMYVCVFMYMNMYVVNMYTLAETVIIQQSKSVSLVLGVKRMWRSTSMRQRVEA